MPSMPTLAVVVLAVLSTVATPVSAHDELTPAQRAAGWTSLFDGHSTDSWRSYRGTSFPTSGWTVEDECLTVGSGGGDIVTVDEYGDFELELEWMASPGANSGIMYRVTEDRDAPWMTGPEYQIFDDAGHNTPADAPFSAGALYDLAAPVGKTLKPAGEWNHARIRLQNGRLRHWLNGDEIVDVRVDDSTWTDRIAWSKFKAYPGFGVQPRGRIALQDHGDEVRFRRIRIRDLDAPLPGEIALFNGRDLDGLVGFLPDGTDPSAVWSVRDGVLVCSGQPVGYIHTADDYDNYVLKLEWRFNPITGKAGNSGVLLRKVGEDKVWPKSVEAQLHSGSAGDFWNIGDFAMSTDPARTNGRNTRKTSGNENPLGQWNEYEIIVDGGDVVLMVNGEELNRAWDVEEVAGPIALQSEGAEIHFRNIRLAPITR